MALVGGEEQVDLAIVVEIPCAYACAVVVVHVFEYVELLGRVERISEIQACRVMYPALRIAACGLFGEGLQPDRQTIQLRAMVMLFFILMERGDTIQCRYSSLWRKSKYSLFLVCDRADVPDLTGEVQPGAGGVDPGEIRLCRRRGARGRSCRRGGRTGEGSRIRCRPGRGPDDRHG